MTEAEEKLREIRERAADIHRENFVLLGEMNEMEKTISNRRNELLEMDKIALELMNKKES